MRTYLLLLIFAACSLTQVVVAEVVDPKGILTEVTLSRNNPRTFQKWKAGDQYRLVFITSAKRTAFSTSIATYNNWVQQLADASPYPIGAEDGFTWKVIGSTDTMDARDNTSTNPTVDGLGCPIFLLNGQTVVASSNSQLWGGGSISNIINLTEKGDIYTGWPWTGTYEDGSRAVDHAWSFNALGGSTLSGSEIHINQGNSSSRTDWLWRYWLGDPPDTLHTMYAMSDPITIIDTTPNSFTIKARGGFFDLRWPSEVGKIYDLVSSTSLDTDPDTWPVYSYGYSNMAGTGTGFNYLTLSRDGNKRFYAIIER